MMDALPEGTVTILFTDVEASTELHVQRGDHAAAAVLASYEHLVREQVEQHDGVAVKSLGDGLMSAFSSARKGVACAVSIQRSLHTYGRVHPGDHPRVRIGLNTGEVTQSDGDLQGVAVSAAARVAAKAAGGEILVPAVVKELAGVMPGVTFANRGRFRLKGFPERWQLFEVVWRAAAEPAASAATLSERAAFVGRARERALLTNALDRAMNGQGSLVMIGGEPGVGKTRLCEELMSDALQRGCRVLAGHCYESEAAVPYMPFVEILEKASQVVEPDLFLQALGESAPEVARILPRLRRMFPQIPAPLQLPPEQERRYLFTSIDEFLRRGAAARPQVTILEDLHWADESTLLLLQHIAAQLGDMRTLVLATYRDVELGVDKPLARTLESLIRSGTAQRLSLRRLDEAGVAAMLRSFGGHDAPPALVSAVYRETEGNPFFVQEVFKYLAEKGRLLDASGRFSTDLTIGELDVPESVRLVIGRRLERLSEASRRVLSGAAILGHEFGYRLLELVSDLAQDAVLDAVDEAERAHIIVGGGGRDVSFRFAHELMRQTLLNELSTPRRQRLHLRCADALERVLGRDVDAHISEIAHHLFEAGAIADPERTLTALRRAAERALDAAAYEDALQLLDCALLVAPPDDALGCARINEDLGLAFRGAGRMSEAEAAWESALATYESENDAESVARLASTMATHLNWAGRQLEAAAVAARGLAASEGVSDTNRISLLGQAAVAFSFAGDNEAGETQGAEAYELARSSGDPALVATAGVWMTLHKFFWLEPAQAAEYGEAAARTLRENGAWWELCDLLAGGLMWARFFRGDLDGLLEGGEECLVLARRVGHTAAEAAASRVRVAQATRVGDLTQAADLIHRHRDFMAQSGYLWAFDTHAYSAYIDFCNGAWEAAEREAHVGEEREIPCVFAGIPSGVRVVISAYLGRTDDVMEVLAARRSELPQQNAAATLGSWTLAMGLIEALFIAGAYDEAATLRSAADELLRRGSMVNWVAMSATRTSAALAAAAAADWDAAETHFRHAVADADALKFVPLMADTRRLYATALRERGPAGRDDDVQRLLADAFTRYRTSGMARHAALTQALQRRGR